MAKRKGAKRDNYYRGQYTRPPARATPPGRPADWADITPAATRPISMGPDTDVTLPAIPPPLATDYGVGGNFTLPGMESAAPAVPDPTMGGGALGPDVGFQGNFLSPEQATALTTGFGPQVAHRTMNPAGLHPQHLNILAHLARARAAAMAGSQWSRPGSTPPGHPADWMAAPGVPDPWSILAAAARRRLAQHVAGAI